MQSTYPMPTPRTSDGGTVSPSARRRDGGPTFALDSSAGKQKKTRRRWSVGGVLNLGSLR